MRVHRFYLPEELTDSLQISDTALVHQWQRVLRVPEGNELRLFNGKGKERTYRIDAYTKDYCTLSLVREGHARVPSRSLTLFFSLLKKEKNEWVIQKGTEIGVTHFVPIISERTEKTGFPLERMRKIAIEAAEQCGRADVPEIASPVSLESAVKEYARSMTLFVCHEGGMGVPAIHSESVGCFIGPEGGWSNEELDLFSYSNIRTVSLGEFTLRAETACLAATLAFSAVPDYQTPETKGGE